MCDPDPGTTKQTEPPGVLPGKGKKAETSLELQSQPVLNGWIFGDFHAFSM